MKTTKAKGAQSATSLPRAPEDDLHNRTVRYGLTILALVVALIILHKWLPAGTRKLREILPGIVIPLPG